MNKLHVRSKIFFEESTTIHYHAPDDKDISKVILATSSNTSGSWGYSQRIASVVLSGNSNISIYFVFEDKSDATAFLLRHSRASEVKIWPNNCLFTIHEVTLGV